MPPHHALPWGILLVRFAELAKQLAVFTMALFPVLKAFFRLWLRHETGVPETWVQFG